MLSYMHGRLEYLRPSLTALLRSASEQFPETVFLGDCCERMRGGEAFPEAWEAAIDRDGEISGRQAVWLRSLGATLGSADLSSQLTALRYTRELLVGDLARTQQEEHARARLFKNLGVLGGLLAVIIFI